MWACDYVKKEEEEEDDEIRTSKSIQTNQKCFGLNILLSSLIIFGERMDVRMRKRKP